MPGKRRCKHHGGASPGAPKGNKNAFRHGLYSDALLPEEEAIWDHVKGEVGKLDDEITLMRIRLMRLNRLQKEADAATISGKNESKALQLEEISQSESSEYGRTNTVVKRRRDYHAEIRQVTKLIGELEEKRARLLTGDTPANSEPPQRIEVTVLDARRRPAEAPADNPEDEEVEA